jgi:hypothetical protein
VVASTTYFGVLTLNVIGVAFQVCGMVDMEQNVLYLGREVNKSTTIYAIHQQILHARMLD